MHAIAKLSQANNCPLSVLNLLGVCQLKQHFFLTANAKCLQVGQIGLIN